MTRGADEHCGACTAPAVAAADPAAIGQTCGNQIGNRLCGDDGETYRGQCTSPNSWPSGNSPLVCKKRCELGTTCATGACTMDVFSYTPVCP